MAEKKTEGKQKKSRAGAKKQQITMDNSYDCDLFTVKNSAVK